MQRPIQRPWKFVVIARVTLSQESKEVFVDEVEPEKSVSSLPAGVPQSGEDVPRSCNQEKQSQSRGQAKFAPSLPFSRYGEIDKRRATWESQRNQAFRQDP